MKKDKYIYYNPERSDIVIRPISCFRLDNEYLGTYYLIGEL